MNLNDVLKPGDVLAVRSPGWPAWWIRFGAALANKPNLQNHIAVMHHYDSSGVPWGLEGKPGGVGWVDLRNYLRDPYTLNNCAQPLRVDWARALAAKAAQGMLGTPYDWEAILGDGFSDIHVKLWNEEFGNTGLKPGHVVCSSFAAYVYAKTGWQSPIAVAIGTRPTAVAARTIQPADWTAFILVNNFNVKLPTC